MSENFIRGFFATLTILQSYLSEIVVGGGWAPFLYYRYLAGDRLHTPVLTSDIDLMVKHDVPIVEFKTIDQLLLDAKLEAIFRTNDNPPIIHYEGTIEGAEVEIEFVTDQTGSRPDVVLEVQKGLHAEALRYVSILVENTLKLTIDDTEPITDAPPLIVQVPTPAAYIFQKGLSFTRRRDKPKVAKDLYYIFDILTGLPQIQVDIETDLAVFSKRHARWFRTFMRNLRKYFDSADSEGALCVVEQRPAGAFPDLDDDQLRQFAWGTFEQFIHKLEPWCKPLWR
jgi:hypothetical protein